MLDVVHMSSLSKIYIILFFLGPICSGCHDTTNSSQKLNVDQNIPLSEDFDASYGFWGPRGNKIYFQHSESLGTNPDPSRLDELWELDLKTNQRHMIHSGRILNADISPDGKWFVFHSFSDPEYLYKMKSDGTDLQALTGPNSPNPHWKYTGLGRWSPSGSQILFTVDAGVPRGLSLMDSSGSNPRIIIPYGVDGKWFPDGEKVAYLNWDTTKTSNNQEQIYIANINGSNIRKITSLSHSNYYGDIGEPAVSPDGNYIAFTNLGIEGGGKEIFIMKVDGSDIEQVTEGNGYSARPEWGPDGKTILFTRIIENVSKRLYFLDVGTHQVTPVFPATNP